MEKQKRDAAIKEQQEKEKEAKIRAVHKQKEEKLLLLKKKQEGIVKFAETIGKKLQEKPPVSNIRKRKYFYPSLQSGLLHFSQARIHFLLTLCNFSDGV